MPRPAIIKWAYALKDEVDIVVCISHLGITEDELLAQECPAIDVIFGSHTHHVFEQGRMENGVFVNRWRKVRHVYRAFNIGV